MMHAVRKHTDCKWLLLYIERWLKAPALDASDQEVVRDCGTPQGGVISPLLATYFCITCLMRGWRSIIADSFDRYADDIVIHCRTEAQAHFIRRRIEERLRRCKLQVHQEKTKVVYCKDDDRTGEYPQENFDFLGFCFRPRPSKTRWDKFFVNFSPGASPKALKRIGEQLRDWRIHRKSDKSLDDIARMFNATIRGWIAYLWPLLQIGIIPHPPTA